MEWTLTTTNINNGSGVGGGFLACVECMGGMNASYRGAKIEGVEPHESGSAGHGIVGYIK